MSQRASLTLEGLELPVFSDTFQSKGFNNTFADLGQLDEFSCPLGGEVSITAYWQYYNGSGVAFGLSSSNYNLRHQLETINHDLLKEGFPIRVDSNYIYRD